MSKPSDAEAASPSASVESQRNPELEELRSRVREQTASFVKTLERCSERTGFRRTKELSALITVLPALLATGLVWWRWHWYGGLLAGIGMVFLGAVIFSGSDKKKSETTARVFFHEMLRQPPADRAFFWAVLTDWIPRVTTDPQLKLSLADELARQVTPHRNPQYEEHRRRLEALNADDAAKAAAAKAQAVAEKNRAKEERHEAYRAKIAAERQAKLQAVQAIAPGACLPVGSGDIVLKPSFLTNFSVRWEFAVSDELFLILPDDGRGGALRFPMHCIKGVKIESATAGFSAEALAKKIVNPLFGDHSMRVSVETHLWMHWRSTSAVSGAGVRSYNGVSWEISDQDWAEVGDAWTRFSMRHFPSAPTCPVCGRPAVVAKSAGAAAQPGASEPRMLADCSACSARLEFDLAEGRFLPAREG